MSARAEPFMQEGEWLTSQTVEHRLRVRYAETDQAGIVYHANFLVWFHEARDAAFRIWAAQAARTWMWSDAIRELLSQGRALGTDTLEDIGYRFLIIETSCRHIAPARYGDELLISVVPRKTMVAKLTFAYKVRNARTQRLLAQGQTTSAIIGRDGRMLVRLPADFGWVFHGSAAPKRDTVST